MKLIGLEIYIYLLCVRRCHFCFHMLTYFRLRVNMIKSHFKMNKLQVNLHADRIILACRGHKYATMGFFSCACFAV